MERQTILERLGWRFIRIRGSEYYRDAEQTMQRVMQELTDFEIMPEETQEFAPGTRDTELLQRVKTRANVAHFGTFGYELDLNKLTADERELVRGQIRFMKQYREIIQFGTFYRLISPFDNSQFTARSEP